ncbi:ribonuclease III [Periconia macrospinosa]|uniref:Ribonuclease III n=1 Tax=Periconia macrospinosa TaxID=97972 RepID=A0A2V1EEE8_9PLEO|nr:ribonuclease III [Periconia macrospinosa]
MNQTALEQKWPKKSRDVNVPTYILQQVEKAQSLPPLPPIIEPYLQEAVFTHASVHVHTRVKGSDNSNDITYERLEFLGDAYIELIASRLIYSRLPHVDVPQQAHLREQLVKNETLGQFSIAYGLPDRLKHGAHIKESKVWNKVVADVFEAYVAGVVLSDPQDGFETAESWLTKLWAPQMLDFQPKIIENPEAKHDMARLLQTKDVSLDYREEQDMVYENGVQKYSVGVYLTGWGYENEWLGSGEGRSKAQAAMYAAMDALKRDSAILKNAAKMKQELTEQRQAQRDAMVQEKEEAKAKELEKGTAKEVGGEGHVPARNVAQGPEEKSNGKRISDGDPLLWLEESNRKDKGGSAKDPASWLEKEMKKKEKKEKKRK